MAALHGTDIVLAEGFHQAPGLKIEVLSVGGAQRRCAGDPQLLATVGSATGDASIASFEPDAIKPLADLIERSVLRPRSETVVASRLSTPPFAAARSAV